MLGHHCNWAFSNRDKAPARWLVKRFRFFRIFYFNRIIVGGTVITAVGLSYMCTHQISCGEFAVAKKL